MEPSNRYNCTPYNPLSSIILSSSVNTHQLEKKQNDFFSNLPSRNLSELTPRKIEDMKDTRKALIEYSLLLQGLIKTIEALEAGKLDKFDALVGENQCQIRALIVYFSYKPCLESIIHSKEGVRNALDNVEMLLTLPIKNSCVFKSFLESKNLEIHLTGTEALFVELYLLTVIKDQTGNVSQPLRLQELAPDACKKLEITKKFTEILVKKFCKDVSAISSPLLRSLAFEFGDTASLEMLAEEYTLSIEGRFCPPSFWTIKLMLLAALCNKIGIVLWFKQKSESSEIIKKDVCIYYESNLSKTSLIAKSPFLKDAKSPIIVIQTKFRSKIPHREISYHDIKLNVVDHVAVLGARHRQYLDKRKDILVQETPDASYHYYLNKPIEQQWYDEPSELHIFCDLMKNIKPIKYEMHSYLETTYGDFYRKIGSARLKDIYDLRREHKFDPLAYAIYHENPVKFIMDHRPYWDCGPPPFLSYSKYIEFITAKPENFNVPEVMNILSDLIQDPYRSSIYIRRLESVIVGISKALDIQEVGIQERAIDLLIYAGSQYDPVNYYDNCYQVTQRSISRKALTKLREHPQHPKIKIAFKEMLENEPLVQLKIELLNMLDEIDHIANQLDSTIIDLSSTWNSNHFFWNNPDSLTFKENEKARDIAFNKLLELVQSEKSDKSLRIVAIRYLSNYFITTTEEFMVHPVVGPNLKPLNIKRRVGRYLKPLDTISTVIPARKVSSIPIENSIPIRGPRIVLSSLVDLEDKLSSYSTEVLPSKFCQIGNVLNTLPANPVIQKEQAFIRAQQAYRQTISYFLISFIQNEIFDADLRGEASSLLSMIVAHLKRIEKDEHPISEIKNEIPKLLQWLENK